MKSRFNFLVRMLLGLMFIAAAAAKGTDVVDFIRKIDAMLLQLGFHDSDTTAVLAAGAAIILLTLEFLLGSFLLAGHRIRTTAAFTSVLMAFFTLVAGLNLLSARKESCGCFGTLFSRSPSEELVENLILLFFALALAMRSHRTPGRRLRTALVLPAAALLWTTFFYLFPAPWASVRQGMYWKTFTAAPKLELEGLQFVWLLDPECYSCLDQIPFVENLSGHYKGQVTALTSASEGRLNEFIFDFEPQFRIRRIDNGAFEKLGLTAGSLIILGDGVVDAIIPQRKISVEITDAGRIKQIISD